MHSFCRRFDRFASVATLRISLPTRIKRIEWPLQILLVTPSNSLQSNQRARDHHRIRTLHTSSLGNWSSLKSIHVSRNVESARKPTRDDVDSQFGRRNQSWISYFDLGRTRKTDSRHITNTIHCVCRKTKINTSHDWSSSTRQKRT